MVENSLDYYTTNAIDQVAMITTLRLLGNKRAELVVTSGKGYRADLGGIRQPHSWSIVDEADLGHLDPERPGSRSVFVSGFDILGALDRRNDAQDVENSLGATLWAALSSTVAVAATAQPAVATNSFLNISRTYSLDP